MSTLHIEHKVSDFTLWQSAFATFSGAREQAGVLAHRVQRAVDDPSHIAVDLDFATAGEALGFLEFLKTKVWAAPESSPALASPPQARVFVTAG